MYFFPLKLRNSRFYLVVGDTVWKEVSLPQRSHWLLTKLVIGPLQIICSLGYWN